MSKACIHIQNIKITKSEQHNLREIFVSYANPQLKQFNEHWATDSISDRRENIRERYLRHVGRKQPSNATPIKEAVVLIKNGATMDDLHNLNKALEKELGISCFRIDIHRDEGHHDNSGRWKPNLHAHLTIDMTHKETGISVKMNREKMILLQDIASRELRMERGTPTKITGRQHIDPITFKAMKERERIDLLRVDKKYYDNLCAKAQKITEGAGIDITGKMELCLKQSSSFAEYKSLLADQNIEVIEVKSKDNEIGLVYDASKVKTSNPVKIIFESALPLRFSHKGITHFEGLQKSKKTRSEFNQKMFVSAKIKTCKEESNNFNEFLEKAKAAGIDIVPQHKKDKVIGYTATAPEFANAITFNHRELRKECHAYFLLKSFEQKDAPSKPETKKYSVPQQATILKRLMGKAAKEMTSVDHFFELLEASNVKVHKNLTAGRATGYSIELGDTDSAKIFKSSQIDRNLSISKLKNKVQKEESKSKEIIPSDTSLALEPTPKEPTKTADKQPDKAPPKQTIPVNASIDEQMLAMKTICIEAKKESKSIDEFISILATKDVKVIPATKEDQTISYTAVFQNVEDPLPVPLSDLKDLNLADLPKATPKEAPKEKIKAPDKQPDKAPPKQTIPVNASAEDQKLAIESICMQAKKESKSIDEFISILATKDVKVIPATKEDQTISYTAVFQNVEDPLSVPLLDVKDLNLADLPKATPKEAPPKQTIPFNASIDDQKLAIENLCMQAKKESKSIEDFIGILATKDVKVTPETKEDQTISYTAVFQNVEDPLPVPLLDVKDLNLETLQKEESKSKEIIPSDKGLELEPTPKEPTKTADKQPDQATAKETIPVNASIEKQISAMKKICIESKNESKSIDEFISILAKKGIEIEGDKVINYAGKFKNVNASQRQKISLSAFEGLNLAGLPKETPKEAAKEADKQPDKATPKQTIPFNASIEKQISAMKTICIESKNESKSIDEFISILAKKGIEIEGDKVINYAGKFKNVNAPQRISLSIFENLNLESLIKETPKEAAKEPTKTADKQPEIKTRSVPQQAVILKRLMVKAAKEMKDVDHFFEILEANNVKVHRNLTAGRVTGYSVEMEGIKDPTVFKSSQIDRSLSVHYLRESKQTKVTIPFHSSNKKQISTMRDLCFVSKSQAGNIDDFIKELQKNNARVTEIKEFNKIVDYVVKFEKVANPIPLVLSKLDDTFKLENFTKETPKEPTKTTDKLPERSEAQQRTILKRLMTKAAKDPVGVRRFFETLEGGNVKVHKNLTAGKVTGYGVELKNVANPVKFKSSEVDRKLTLFNLEKSFQDKADKSEIITKFDDTLRGAKSFTHLESLLNKKEIKIHPIKENGRLKSYTLEYKNKSFPSIELPPKYHPYNVNDHFKLKSIIYSPFGKFQKTSYGDKSQAVFLGIKSALWNSKNESQFINQLLKNHIETKKVGKDYHFKFHKTDKPIWIPMSDIDKKYTSKKVPFMLKNKSNDGAYSLSKNQVDHLKKVCFEKLEMSKNIDEFIKHLERANIKVVSKVEGGKAVNYALAQTDLVNPLPFPLKEIDESLELDNLKTVFEKNSKNKVSASDQKTLLEKGIIDSITLSTSVDFDSFFENLQRSGFEIKEIYQDGKLADFEITNNRVSNSINIKASQVREEFSVGNFLEVFESRDESRGQAFQTGNAPSVVNSLMGLFGEALLQGGGQEEGQQQGVKGKGRGKKPKQEEENEEENRGRGKGFSM